jgi:hypothetical protein
MMNWSYEKCGKYASLRLIEMSIDSQLEALGYEITDDLPWILFIHICKLQDQRWEASKKIITLLDSDILGN